METTEEQRQNIQTFVSKMTKPLLKLYVEKNKVRLTNFDRTKVDIIREKVVELIINRNWELTMPIDPYARKTPVDPPTLKVGDCGKYVKDGYRSTLWYKIVKINPTRITIQQLMTFVRTKVTSSQDMEYNVSINNNIAPNSIKKSITPQYFLIDRELTDNGQKTDIFISYHH